MTWAGWFFVGYMSFSAWVGAAVYLVEVPAGTKDKPGKAMVFAILLMWLLPAFFIGAFFGRDSDRDG